MSFKLNNEAIKLHTHCIPPRHFDLIILLGVENWESSAEADEFFAEVIGFSRCLTKYKNWIEWVKEIKDVAKYQAHFCTLENAIKQKSIGSKLIDR